MNRFIAPALGLVGTMAIAFGIRTSMNVTGTRPNMITMMETPEQREFRIARDELVREARRDLADGVYGQDLGGEVEGEAWTALNDKTQLEGVFYPDELEAQEEDAEPPWLAGLLALGLGSLFAVGGGIGAWVLLGRNEDESVPPEDPASEV